MKLCFVVLIEPLKQKGRRILELSGLSGRYLLHGNFLRLGPYGLSFKMFSSVLPFCLQSKYIVSNLDVAEFIALVNKLFSHFLHNWVS